jgi:adenine/guanine/hypoxanthine permease
MMVYVILNTMIWFVVFLSGGRIEPANYEEKEVYNFGFGRRDLPAWAKIMRRKVRRRGSLAINTKHAVDVPDNDSTIHNGSSRMESAEDDKDMYALTERARSPRHVALTG